MLIVTCIAAMALIGGAFVVRADDDKPAAKTAAKEFKPVLSVHTLMEGQQYLFGNLRSLVSERKWEDAHVAAGLLAELGNVNVHHAKDDAYTEFAQTMSGKSKSLSDMLKRKDAEGSKRLMSEVGASCKACHDKFR
jgi:hypothetical protein